MSPHVDASVVGEPLSVVPFFLFGAVFGLLYDCFYAVRLVLEGSGTVHARFCDSFLQQRVKYVIIKYGKQDGKRSGRYHKVVTFFCDLVFCLLFTLGYTVLQFCINSGVFRWYLLVCTGLGFVLYRISLSAVLRGVILECYALLRGTVVFAYNHSLYFLLYGIAYLLRCFCGVLRRGWRHVRSRLYRGIGKRRTRKTLRIIEKSAGDCFGCQTN